MVSTIMQVGQTINYLSLNPGVALSEFCKQDNLEENLHPRYLTVIPDTFDTVE